MIYLKFILTFARFERRHPASCLDTSKEVSAFSSATTAPLQHNHTLPPSPPAGTTHYSIMAQKEYFRFMDLPRELRLMVYEWLPIKTTHQKVRTPTIHKTTVSESILFSESDAAGNNLTDQSGGKVPQASLVIVQKRLSGVAILCTAREVAREAQPILRHKLDLLRNAPLRIIINNLAFITHSINFNLRRLWYDYKEGFVDFSPDATFGHRGGAGPHYKPKFESPDEYWDVEIAVRNQFRADEKTNAQTCDVRMRRLLRCFDQHQRMEATRVWTCSVHVLYRMALLSAQEKGASDAIRPLHSPTWSPGAYLSSKAGDDIDVDEWQRQWAVGEVA